MLGILTSFSQIPWLTCKNFLSVSGEGGRSVHILPGGPRESSYRQITTFLNAHTATSSNPPLPGTVNPASPPGSLCFEISELISVAFFPGRLGPAREPQESVQKPESSLMICEDSLLPWNALGRVSYYENTRAGSERSQHAERCNVLACECFLF